MIPLPFISIVIPTKNSEKYIHLCLNSLNLLHYPEESYEIIVVDNGSVDKTNEIIKNYPIKSLIIENCNISAVRNWGTRHAKGEIFAFLDSDCIVPTNWLNTAASVLESKQIGIVGAWYSLPQKPLWIEKVWDICTTHRLNQKGPIDWLPSSNLFIKRDLFRDLNGFNEDLITSEDVDICYRARKKGKIVYSEPQITVQHLGNPKTIKQFFFKEKWRGEGVLQNSFKNFPRIEVNNALSFGIITLISILGILSGALFWAVNGSNSLFLFSILGLLAIPLLMTIKTLSHRHQWNNFLILFMLFIIYGIARASSVFTFAVWINLIKRKNNV